MSYFANIELGMQYPLSRFGRRPLNCFAEVSNVELLQQASSGRARDFRLLTSQRGLIATGEKQPQQKHGS